MPGLTVVAQDPRELGREGAELLFSRLDGYDGPTRQIVIPTTLIERGLRRAAAAVGLTCCGADGAGDRHRRHRHGLDGARARVAYRRVLEHFPDLGVRPRLVSAADVSEERRRHAERVGFETTTGDWRAVIDDPRVDVVNVTLPNAMHREVAVAALEAGKHVWVEKPVGRGLEDTAGGRRRRAARGRRHRRRLLLPLRARRPARARADRGGAIGEVNHYRGVFLADYANRPDAAASWRFPRAVAGSGALGDLMAHVVDMTHHPGRADRAAQRPHRDADPAAAARDGRGHALQPRRERRPRRRRQRGLGGRAVRARGRHGRLARGEPRRSSARACRCASRSTARAARWRGSSSG